MNKELREQIKRFQKGYPATARLDYYLEAAQARKATATDESDKRAGKQRTDGTASPVRRRH